MGWIKLGSESDVVRTADMGPCCAASGTVLLNMGCNAWYEENAQKLGRFLKSYEEKELERTRCGHHRVKE